MTLHPFAGLCNLEMGRSDHRPICLDTEYLASVAERNSAGGRKFEARWLSEETVEEVAKTAWQKAIKRGVCPTINAKLASVHTDLHSWDRRVLKQHQARLKKAQNELELLMRTPPTSEVRMKQKELAPYVENLLEQDEVYWAHRGRVSWLRPTLNISTSLLQLEGGGT